MENSSRHTAVGDVNDEKLSWHLYPTVYIETVKKLSKKWLQSKCIVTLRPTVYFMMVNVGSGRIPHVKQPCMT